MDDTGKKHEAISLPRVRDFKAAPTTIRGCPRCQGDHPRLIFKPFTHPPSTGHNAWAICPTNGEPIFMTCYFDVGDLAGIQAELKRLDAEEKAKAAAAAIENKP